MNVINLNTTTPYTNVVALAVNAIHQHDFSFDVDRNGDLRSMTIYDDLGGAVEIEMDCIMFLEVYTLATSTNVLLEGQRLIIEPILQSLN